MEEHESASVDFHPAPASTPPSAEERYGIAMMRGIVEERNAFKRPYRVSLAERARMSGKEELLADLRTHIEERITSILFERTGPNPTPRYIEWARDAFRNELFSVASAAREFGMHYRKPNPFHVGAAMLALRKTEEPGENPWVVLFDANTKANLEHVASKEGEKWCAEQYLMDRITEPANPSEAGIYKVISFAVVGEARPDDASVHKGVEQITLTPCQICRDRMMYDEQLTTGRPIISAKTEVATADMRTPAIQKLLPVGDLHRFHKENVEID